MVNEMRVGDGKVFLIAGGGRSFADVAARFCRTEKDVEDIIASPQSKKIIHDLITSGHKAALEFDTFLFGIQGYARVTEVQLVRKRHGSYMIKSGRVEEHGKRNMDVVVPDNITRLHTKQLMNPEKIRLKFSNPSTGITEVKLNDCFPFLKQQFGQMSNPAVIYDYNYHDIFELIDTWYNEGVRLHIPEEDLRYVKPLATEFKAAVMFNCSGLRDLIAVRCCRRAQTEIRDLVTKMWKLAREAAPELMEDAGPSCVTNGFCSELEQHPDCVGKIPTRNQVKDYINKHRQEMMQ